MSYYPNGHCGLSHSYYFSLVFDESSISPNWFTLAFVVWVFNRVVVIPSVVFPFVFGVVMPIFYYKQHIWNITHYRDFPSVKLIISNCSASFTASSIWTLVPI